METLSQKAPAESFATNEYGFVRMKKDTWRLLRREAFEREISMGQLIDQLLRAAQAKGAKRSA